MSQGGWRLKDPAVRVGAENIRNSRKKWKSSYCKQCQITFLRFFVVGVYDYSWLSFFLFIDISLFFCD